MISSGLSLVFLALAINFADAILPGVAPRSFKDGEKLPVKVNSLSCAGTTCLPYDYYSLPFCQPPPDQLTEDAENLGEILLGDRIQSSLYDLRVGEDKSCKVLCVKYHTEKEIKAFEERISEGYVVNWIVDNLPAAGVYEAYDDGAVIKSGFDIGSYEGDDIYLNNHLIITVRYHQENGVSGKRIIEVVVQTRSVNHTSSDTNSDGILKDTSKCASEVLGPLFITGNSVKHEDDGKVKVIYTYDVVWKYSDVKWSSRWDIYLKMDNQEENTSIHWETIMNSLLIIVLLTGMVALILTRVLRKDLMYYNRVMTEEERLEEQDESGWKLVHGDVFRPPTVWPMLFSVFVGSGMQLFGMSCGTIAFACIGFLSPAMRGSVMIALVSFFVFLGTVSGYYAAAMYKVFGGKDWQKCILLTSLLFPGIVFAIFFIVNLFVWHQGSSGAVPFTSLFAVFFLWVGISIPLTFLGAYFGFRRETLEVPCVVSPYPRQIPPQIWYLRKWITVPFAGILPFGAISIEATFIFNSLWLDKYYYVFGFLAIIFVLLCITCAEVSMVLCYFQLCSEDYRWWWRTFFTSGSSAVYLWLYSIFFYCDRMHTVTATAALVYFSYSAIITIAYFLTTGVLGFSATFWFVHKIYGSLKVD